VIAASFSGVDVVYLVIIIALLLASGALAAAETSLVRTNKVKARSLQEERRRGAKALVDLVEHPEKFLNPVLLLVLICQLVSATLIGVLAANWLGSWGVLVATAFEVVVIFVFFEAVPKNWAVHHPERAALASAPVVKAVINFPLIKAISTVLIGLADLILGRRGDNAHISMVTESELLAMADVAQAESVIDSEEREFIHSVIDFGDTVVREVMVPRPDMVALENSITVSDALVEALELGFSRLPVYEESIDDVIGIAYIRDLMRLERDGRGDELVAEHLRSATFVPETKPVPALLREMQRERIHLVVIVDEYGGTAGLATLEDLIEELIGEIDDEFDKASATATKIDEHTFLVPGRMSIDEVDDLIGRELPKGGFDTVGGLLMDLLGAFPEAGESVDAPGATLSATEIDGRKIETVQIVLIDDSEEDA
jgi:putative hemolysin